MKEIVLSGIRATGQLHLGNYLGAMRHFVELSKDPQKKCFFFIANLHTLTTPIDPKKINNDLLNIVLDYLAAGIDPEESIIFAQTSVPETTELCWLLMCLSNISELTRMPHFKEKKEKMESQEVAINAGLLTYPVLMAADILGPMANLVPVGEDQHPHVEFARTLARRFNNSFGDFFPEPNILEGESIRVPGLDGTGKMGKSDGNTINLIDPPELIKGKIARAVTDPARIKRTDPGNPEICKIYDMHRLLSTGEEMAQVLNECPQAKIGCIDCKEILAKNVIKLLLPFQEKRRAIVEKGEMFLLEILNHGGDLAREKIAQTVDAVKDKMGVPFY